MMTMIKSGFLALGLTILCGTSAQASNVHVGVGVRLDGGRYHYREGYERRWVEGYYVTRTQSVVVEPATVERRWVEPVYGTRYHGGHSHSYVIREGYYTTVEIPARYATREVRTWVPGYYEEVPVVVHERRRRSNFSLFLGL
jgi:hypothetical protein